MTDQATLATRYRDQLTALLPQGRAWLRAPGSLLVGLFEGVAEELARFHARADRLIDEFHPGSALEMLEEWETVAGLPDPCLPVTGSITERQKRVATKITSIGGQSRAYFIELAATLGLQIEIDEFVPLRSGFKSGSRAYGLGWQFAWRVRVLPFSEETGILIKSEKFRSGSGRSGDRIRSFSVSELECIIRRAAPAHTRVYFTYPVDPDPILWFDFLSDQGEY